MNTIVTHLSIDLDAVTSAWLIKRFMPGWQNANLTFVPAGTTLDNKPPDENPQVIHVDTGLGKFDHHQMQDRSLCAAKRVFEYLIEKNYIPEKEKEAISRITNFVVIDDNFLDVFWPDPAADIYDFAIHRLIDGFKVSKTNDEERCEIIFELLNTLVLIFKSKLRAEEEIKKGFIFNSKWGKILALETPNPDVEKLGLKMGFSMVVRKDPQKGFLRIKTLPKKELDLTSIHNELVKNDPNATWFLHISKNMLLNGTSKNPSMIPSKLPLKKVIEIIKNI